MNRLPKCLFLFIFMVETLSASVPSPKGSLERLTAHFKGQEISVVEFEREASILTQPQTMELVAEDKKLLLKVFDLVLAYENSEKYGTLFLSPSTRNGLNRKKREGLEVDFAMADIMQAIIDHIYTPKNLVRHTKILSNRKFLTSDYFPGAVTPPSNPKATISSKINAMNRESWGSPTAYEKRSAIRATGCYLAPGSIAKVIVPDSMVGRGFSVRVGSHSWDHSKKPTMKRLDRVSILYPITQKETLIGSPLGGGIYIEVPYLMAMGVVEVEIQNAVRSPHFSARSFDKMTSEQWRNEQRNNVGAWADFESDKFMMNLPTSWISKFDDPVSLMAQWDSAMDVIFDLRGLDSDRFDKTLLYVQIDVQMRGSANFPGYPQSNDGYKPTAKESGDKNHWMLRGGKSSSWTLFHELGHAVLITKFRGETEALVNFMHVAVMNRAFGRDLDQAFGESVMGQSQISIDEAAIMWMVTENFREGREMNYTNRPGDEFKYQHRGHAKYADIVRLFGWESLDRFWRSANEDYMGAKAYFPRNRNQDPVDSRILHLSIAAGCDLTPLIHFWGIHPENPERLKTQIAEAGLKPSQAIKDLLLRYLTLIPKDNSEFCDHMNRVYPKGLKLKKNSNPLYGEGWYNANKDLYQEECYTKAVESLKRIIMNYFE